MLYQSVCQPSDPSFIWMETGKVEFFPQLCPLHFEHFPSATVHMFALSGPSFTLPFSITNLGQLAGPTIYGFSVYALFTLRVSLLLLLFFFSPCLPRFNFFLVLPHFYSSFFSVSISLSSIFTLIYLSQFCLEEESHFLPIFNKSEDVFLDNIKY